MSPNVIVSYNGKDEGYIIEVKLLRVKKEDVKLYFWSKGFCVDDERKNLTYTGCFNLAREVKIEEAKAKFENWLLTITVLFTCQKSEDRVA